MTDTPDLASRATYSWWYQEKLRFSDTDMIGHINNVAFAALMESGRVNFTRSGVIENMPDDVLTVMRRIELDYRAELHWPGEVDIGAVLLRIGRSSFTLGNGLFHGKLCAATSVTTLVMIGRHTRRAEPIPEIVRTGMQRYLAGNAAVWATEKPEASEKPGALPLDPAKDKSLEAVWKLALRAAKRSI